MNVEFINPFLKAIVNVLSTMAQIDTQPGKPCLKRHKLGEGDVTGMIGLVGPQAKGSLAISFSESCILAVASNMFGEDLQQLDGTIADLVGEITNMVTGGAKRELAEKGYKFEMAIPTTIMGKGHTISHKTHGPVMIIPFETDSGDFFIEVCFDQ